MYILYPPCRDITPKSLPLMPIYSKSVYILTSEWFCICTKVMVSKWLAPYKLCHIYFHLWFTMCLDVLIFDLIPVKGNNITFQNEIEAHGGLWSASWHGGHVPRDICLGNLLAYFKFVRKYACCTNPLPNLAYANVFAQKLHILDMCLGAYPPKTDMHSGLIVRHLIKIW